MTPSNPTNQQPLIYRIADALGINHLVVPTQHTHSRDEVAGLENFINTHSHMINKHNGDAYAYVDVQSDTDNGKAKIELGIEDASESEYSRKIAITWENIKNFARALLDPDTTPTANSDNLVTSGGVKAALDNKTSISHEDMDSIIEVEVKHVGDDEYDQAKVIGRNRILIGVGADAEDGSAIINANNIANLQRAIQAPDSTPIANSTNLVTSGGVKAALNQKADTLAVNTALAGKAPLADTQVLYMAIDEDGGRVTEIDVDALFTSGNTQVSLLIESLAKSNVKLNNVFTSAGRAFTFLTDLKDIPVGAVISCRIIFSDDPSTETKYFVVIDGIWVPQS